MFTARLYFACKFGCELCVIELAIVRFDAQTQLPIVYHSGTCFTVRRISLRLAGSLSLISSLAVTISAQWPLDSLNDFLARAEFKHSFYPTYSSANNRWCPIQKIRNIAPLPVKKKYRSVFHSALYEHIFFPSAMSPLAHSTDLVHFAGRPLFWRPTFIRLNDSPSFALVSARVSIRHSASSIPCLYVAEISQHIAAFTHAQRPEMCYGC